MRKYIPPTAKLLPPEATKVFSGKIWDVYQWPQTMFDGSTETFEMLARPDTVKIIAIKYGKIIVTQQEQPRKDCFLDYPGGRVDASDVDELAAAKREMREETGLIFRHWKLIKVEQPFSKIDWLVYTFLAWDFVEQTPQELDAGEKIQVLALDVAEVNRLSQTPESRYLEIVASSLDELYQLPALYNYDAEA